MLKRVVRNAAIACVAMATAAFVWVPARPLVALGVIAGGVLAGLSFWGVTGVAGSLRASGENGEIRPKSGGFSLVKFFTRYVILALGAYVMMVRLHLDPIGMLLGVTSVVVAAAVEAARQ